MNARDFCFWIQGYTELTGGEYPPSVAWNLILEHLELAKLQEGFSEEEFEGVVAMLSGFVSVSGSIQPTEEEWSRIVDIVANTFVKVTSTLDELEENEEIDDSTDIIKIIEDAIKKHERDKPPFPVYPPYQPYPAVPWKDTNPLIPDPWSQPPTIICSDEPKSSVFCTSTGNSGQLTPDMALEIANELSNEIKVATCGDMYDSQMPSTDMYELGIDIADSKLA